jgi:hypothetical protein
VKTSIALALLLSGSLAAYAQTERPTPDHRYHAPHHTIHHHFEARNPAEARPPTAAAITPAPAPQAAPFGLAFPHIAPYPDGKGDEDGLSEDPNDCNKGCIGGNTPD